MVEHLVVRISVSMDVYERFPSVYLIEDSVMLQVQCSRDILFLIVRQEIEESPVTFSYYFANVLQVEYSENVITLCER